MAKKPKRKLAQTKKTAEQRTSELDRYEDVMEKKRQLDELVERSNGGDEAALADLRGILWSPGGKVFVNMLGNVAMHARKVIIRRLAPNQEAAHIAIHQKAGDLARELEGPNANAIERLLAERIVMAWLQAADADLDANAKPTSVQVADFYQRRLDRAQRRLLAAIKALATVRRLASPIRVNLQVSGAVETKSEPALPTPEMQTILATRWQTAGADN